jgi:hypothetical protein
MNLHRTINLFVIRGMSKLRLLISVQVAFGIATFASADEYLLTDLGFGRSPAALNNGGQVAGSYRLAPQQYHACTWSSGQALLDLGLLPGMVRTGCQSINSQGHVTGRGFNDWINPSHQTGFAWSAETGMVPLTPLGGDSDTEGWAIADDGRIAGTSYRTGVGPRAVTWLDPQTPSELSAPAGAVSYVTSMNNVGQLVGAIDGQATLWDDQGAHPLSQITHVGLFEPIRINGNGALVGPGQGHPVIYRPGIGWSDIAGLPGAAYTTASGINNSDQVVGECYFSQPERYVAFIWSPTLGTRRLDELAPIGSFTHAWDINDTGQIIVACQGFPDGAHGALLSPVPEPGSLLVIVTGAGLLLQRRRLHRSQQR